MSVRDSCIPLTREIERDFLTREIERLMYTLDERDSCIPLMRD